jgi:threonine dehydratase
LQFLESLDASWNISLFHYRNHGSAHGRVLAGIQVPDADLDRFYASLARLGYPYKEQSDNPAYHLFLK